MSDISKNIKKYRTKVNLTQQELADRLNVTRQAVSSFYNIHVKEKKSKRLLLVISIVLLVGVNVFFNIYFGTRHGKTVMDYLYVIFSILLFFGIAKEPEVEALE